MCLTPACTSGFRDFQLRGPVGKPPKGGWKIRQLPEVAAGLQQAWMVHAGKPQSGRAAWIEMWMFLANNGITSPEVAQAVEDAGIDQWCADPSRCDKKWRRAAPVKPEPRFFAWAKAAWEELNNTLADGTDEAAIPHILNAQISKLTALINPTNPTGCPTCYVHWLRVLEENPQPDPPTLDAARRWVVKIHNETREAREPVPYETIAAKFRWSDPAVQSPAEEAA